MNIFSLICFITLAENLNFSESADILHISQSAFSKRISSLEDEWNAQLFIRGPHGVSLTPAARSALVYANRIVSEYRNMERLIGDYRRKRDKRLVVYSHSFLAPYGLSLMLWRFQEINPELQLEILESEDTFSLKMLHADPSVVIIVFNKPEPGERGIDCYPLLSDELVVQMGRHHHFAPRERLHISELRDETFQIMLRPQEPVLYSFVTEQCRKAGFEPKLNSYGLWPTSIISILRSQSAVSVLPRKIAEYNCPSDIITLPVDGVERISMHIIKDTSNFDKPAIQLIEFATKYEF